MPFNYDPQRLNDPKNNVFVHQELEIPKPSTLATPGSYHGYANGKDVTNILMVDGNNKTKDIVHFMLSKPIVQQISNEYLKDSNNKTNGMMTFSLVPSKNGSVPMSGDMNMTMDMGMK